MHYEDFTSKFEEMVMHKIVKTVLLDGTHWADVVIVGAEVKTFLMGKKEEPNVYHTVREIAGDATSALLKEFKVTD
jgi:hypothetical protein